MVSAITHTPASGPFGPVTTPPISSLSMGTAAPAACWASSVTTEPAQTAAMATRGHDQIQRVLHRHGATPFIAVPALADWRSWFPRRAHREARGGDGSYRARRLAATIGGVLGGMATGSYRAARGRAMHMPGASASPTRAQRPSKKTESRFLPRGRSKIACAREPIMAGSAIPVIDIAPYRRSAIPPGPSASPRRVGAATCASNSHQPARRRRLGARRRSRGVSSTRLGSTRSSAGSWHYLAQSAGRGGRPPRRTTRYRASCASAPRLVIADSLGRGRPRHAATPGRMREFVVRHLADGAAGPSLGDRYGAGAPIPRALPSSTARPAPGST